MIEYFIYSGRMTLNNGKKKFLRKCIKSWDIMSSTIIKIKRKKYLKNNKKILSIFNSFILAELGPIFLLHLFSFCLQGVL